MSSLGPAHTMLRSGRCGNMGCFPSGPGVWSTAPTRSVVFVHGSGRLGKCSISALWGTLLFGGAVVALGSSAITAAITAVLGIGCSGAGLGAAAPSGPRARFAVLAAVKRYASCGRNLNIGSH